MGSIPPTTNPAPRFIRGHLSVGPATAICVARSTCPPWWAVRHDPHLRVFYQTLVARHQAKLQALVAVARKMMHAIFGMFRYHRHYDGSRLLPNIEPSSLAAV